MGHPHILYQHVSLRQIQTQGGTEKKLKLCPHRLFVPSERKKKFNPKKENYLDVTEWFKIKLKDRLQIMGIDRLLPVAS